MRGRCDVWCVTDVESLKHCFSLKPDILCELLGLVECIFKKNKCPYGIPALWSINRQYGLSYSC